jgi:hypothetical protein
VGSGVGVEVGFGVAVAVGVAVGVEVGVGVSVGVGVWSCVSSWERVSGKTLMRRMDIVRISITLFFITIPTIERFCATRAITILPY